MATVKPAEMAKTMTARVKIIIPRYIHSPGRAATAVDVFST
jgi:hypothetical protein